MTSIDYAFAGLLGTLVGSFLNVCIYRLPLALMARYQAEAQSFLFPNYPTRALTHWLHALSWPASHCPHCRHPLRWYHNIPMISFIALRGRCAFCSASIAKQYFWVETLSGLVAMFALWHTGIYFEAVILALIFYVLLVIAMIDFNTFYLPNELTMPLLWGGLFYQAFYWGAALSIQDSLMGLLLGYSLLWSASRLFYCMKKKAGMGEGDLILMAALGAWVGPQGAITVVLISALLGLFVGGGWLLYHRHSRETPLPFGPFLAFSGWLVILYPHLSLV